MEKKTKLLIALLVAISLVTAVTAWAETIYLPLVPKDPTNTPTATLQFTNTPTATSTKTATPTKTPTPSGVYILDIEYDPSNEMDEYVVIENNGNNDVDMEGWWIKADRSGARFDFPNNFTLDEDDSVKVWTKVGQNNASNLYWGRTEPVWNNNWDKAYLRDEDGELVDTFSYGDDLLAP